MLGWVLAELMIATPPIAFEGKCSNSRLVSPRHSPLQLAEALLEHLVLPHKVGNIAASRHQFAEMYLLFIDFLSSPNLCGYTALKHLKLFMDL